MCDDVIFRSSFIREADSVLFSFLESVRPEIYKFSSITRIINETSEPRESPIDQLEYVDIG